MARDQAFAAALPLDETAAGIIEWGFQPTDGSTVHQTPPSFMWRPQEAAAHYTLQISRDDDFDNVTYQVDRWLWNAHRPSEAFDTGEWCWRFRYATEDGDVSPWSTVRRFRVAKDAAVQPMPDLDTLLGRLPDSHPRLFVRPEQMPALRDMAQGQFSDIFRPLVSRCEGMLDNPPDVTEPPLYPEGTVRGTPAWRKIWWGNRERVEAVLESALTLAFTWQLGGDDRYRDEARRLLLAATRWDPKGSTGFTYNHEAGMPFLYLFSRAYTFIHDALDADELHVCRDIMRIRGDEVFHDYLIAKDHIWQPYASHPNRAWHYLGEAAIAFHDELAESRHWLDYAMTVYSNVYPVWCGRDGGWHEGMEYFRMYMARFLWWADVMRVALDIDAFEKPFYSDAGYFPMYVMPPGTEAGGFGDHSERLSTDERLAAIMAPLAARAGNGHWQWYAGAVGGPPPADSCVDFIRAGYRRIDPVVPVDLPPSRHFRDIGVAAINTTLLDARDNLSVLFKSSPLGSMSHGYESQNSFIVSLYGKRLFIRSGRRDSYGSSHHADWMWHTKSVNNITINHESQARHTAEAAGRISAYHDDPTFGYVNGEAGDTYGAHVRRYSRAILVIKPELIVVFDRLECDAPATFQWHLHTVNAMQIENQHHIDVENAPAAARVNFLWPRGLSITQSDAFDPPLMPGHDLVQHHLTADSQDNAQTAHFITVFQLHRNDSAVTGPATLARDGDRYIVSAPLRDGRRMEATLDPAENRVPVTAHVLDADGSSLVSFSAADAAVR